MKRQKMSRTAQFDYKNRKFVRTAKLMERLYEDK